ncbi:hypothetical protein ACXU4B_08760 [Dyella soli]|uniref:Uncharacterized protein n=1 Tax=Dyella soli TaxID=522319 RepID=A0A4R0YQB2_9GAMM|nr:hypothetical protein [Dyella soli]TCI11036.1 hypothetical protein EZM97_19650 [Dyella soli]
MRRLLQVAGLIALFLLVPLSVSAAGAPQGPCRLIDPSTCPSASELVRAQGFVSALGHFTGAAKVSYFKSGRSLSEQALYGLGGESQNVVQLSDKRYLFAACPSRDCGGIAAAIVVNEFGQIQAVGFSSFHCESACDDYRHLDFYFRKGGEDDTVLAALKAWGTSEQLRRTLRRPEADEGIESRMDVHYLP